MVKKAKAAKKTAVKSKAAKKSAPAKSQPSALGSFLSFSWLKKSSKK